MIILYIVITILLSSFLFIYMCSRERGLNDGRMKRLYIVLTVVLSSFILLSGREVKAYEYTADLSLINEEFFTFKNNVDTLLEEDTEHLDIYYIVKSGSVYYAYIPVSESDVFSAWILSNKVQLLYGNNNFYRIVYDITRPSTPTISSSPISSYIYVFQNTSTGFNFLYSNIDFPIDNRSNYDLTINYGDREKVVDKGDNLPSLYDLYQMINGPIEPVEPEPVDNTPVLTSFYSLCIQKISYFCEYMATNTLFLTMLVIIILIFIFELIFRRRL